VPDFLSEYIKIPMVKDNDLRAYIILPHYTKELPFVLDTGSPVCYLHSGFLKKQVLPKTSLYRYRKLFPYTRAEGVFEEFVFLSSDKEVIAFLQLLQKNNTLGFSVLKKYDFYIDYPNKAVYFKKLHYLYFDNYRQEDKDLLLTYYPPTFGFSLREFGTRRFVEQIFLNTQKKQLVPEIKFNDELISVNGITLDKIDWSIWYDLDEADFVFKRGKKEFALHLKRQGIEGL